MSVLPACSVTDPTTQRGTTMTAAYDPRHDWALEAEAHDFTEAAYQARSLHDEREAAHLVAQVARELTIASPARRRVAEVFAASLAADEFNAF